MCTGKVLQLNYSLSVLSRSAYSQPTYCFQKHSLLEFSFSLRLVLVNLLVFREDIFSVVNFNSFPNSSFILTHQHFELMNAVDLGMFSFLVGCRFVREWWWVMFRTLWGAAILRARGSWVRGVVSFWKRTLVSRMKVYCSFTSLNLALRTCKHLEKRQLLVFWSPRCSSGRGPLNDLF